MIDLEFLERLIKAIDQSSLDSIEIERGGTRLRLSKSAPQVIGTAAAGTPTTQHATSPVAHAPSAAPVPAPESAAPSGAHLVEVTSPMVGTFYLAPAPDAPSYVEKGKRVSKGDTLCIIEAMKLMNELECEVEGTIVEIVAENAQPVEFGQVLFRVDPA